MKTYFYNRSPYPFIETPVPECFKNLDDHFDAHGYDPKDTLSDPFLRLAENISRRMADIDMYSEIIADVLKDKSPWRGATLAGSFIVGYFSACKSLLDAVSIALAELYILPLSNKEKDFTKTKFWNSLRSKTPEICNRYSRFRAFFEEIVKWRDSAIHRIAPLVIVHGSGPPIEPVATEEVEIKMVADPETDFELLIKNPKDVDWIAPPDLHQKWRSDFISLCNFICQDIQENLNKSSSQHS